MFLVYTAPAAGVGEPGRQSVMRPRTPSILLAALLIAALPLRSRAQLDFQSVETRNMRVVYYDPEHAYIIPHLVRCFENSMAFYYGFVGYLPYEHVTILLQDFDDYGYAGTSTIPNNYLTLGIEPFEYVYETCPTNERFNWVINHELFHVVASEKTSHLDRVWRGIFQGKVLAESDNPESMIYSYLTSPRRFAPRWYHEGIAVFIETWLAGGIGRSLAGYDEMTFRAMVRDGAFFYDLVGLESEGTSSDFQIGQNSYLYGTRFMSHLAAQVRPGEGHRVGQPHRRFQGVLRQPVQAGVRRGAGRRVEGVDRVRARMAGPEPRSHPPVPGDSGARVVRQARWGRCRARSSTPERAGCWWPSTTPATLRTWRPSTSPPGRSRRSTTCRRRRSTT